MLTRNSFLYFILLMILSPLSIANAVEPFWQGIYAGGRVGAVWGLLTNTLNITNDPVHPLFYQPVLPGVNATGTESFNILRMNGGAQVGYNKIIKRVKNNILIGLELSYDYTSLSKTLNAHALYTNSPHAHSYTITSAASAQQLGTLRPRLGYFFGDYLPYITAGGAMTSLKFSQAFTDHQYGITHGNELNQILWGWTVGTGVEYFPFQHMSFKIEYLYNDFGQKTLTSNFWGTGDLTGLRATMRNTLSNIAIQTLLVGVNVHFL